MYGYEWTSKNGIYRLVINSKVIKEIRPVFKKELDYFGFNNYWKYPEIETTTPLLWAEGIRRYINNGECVAIAKGGGFYSKPTIEIYKEKLTLKQINIKALWKENEALMKGLEQKTIAYIREKHDLYKSQGYFFAVAFSGGKDSLVLLDLVSKALSPHEFYIIFSNTGMELSCTLDAIKKAKRHWKNLRFYEASCHMKPEETWDEFGIPGRKLRWCCQVHKSVPTILKMREITKNYNVQTVVFDGVRAEESDNRAQYGDISVNSKNINQVNCSPIFEWGTSELFIYLLRNNLLLNDAYYFGSNRVGCTICPMSSSWRDSLCANLYKNEIKTLFKKVETYTANVGISAKRKKDYIEKDGWRSRFGGRYLTNGGNRITEMIEADTIIFDFLVTKQQWINASLLLGTIVAKRKNKYIHKINKQEFSLSIENRGKRIKYAPYSQMNRFIISHLRGVANKVAYCIGCKACVVHCPSDAFIIDGKSNIFIREEKCIHCSNCIEFTKGKGCLVSKSLSITGGSGMDLKGMNRYQTFGFRQPWLEHFFEYESECFSKKQLGNRQYDALKVWLKEAGLLSPANKGEKSGMPTELFNKLKSLDPFSPSVWAVIWANLAYNSIITRWYMLSVPSAEVYEKNDLIFMLGDDYSPATRDNAVTALLETFRHSPIGSALKQGIPVDKVGGNQRYAKDGWETPDSVAILYSLYLYAEKTGRYTFSLKQMEEAKGNPEALGIDPVSIFGLKSGDFKGILQEIALHYKEYIRVSFVKDLDTVHLMQNVKSIDVISLFDEGAIQNGEV